MLVDCLPALLFCIFCIGNFFLLHRPDLSTDALALVDSRKMKVGCLPARLFRIFYIGNFFFLHRPDLSIDALDLSDSRKT